MSIRIATIDDVRTAEAVVRPRDGEARAVTVSPERQRAIVRQSTLARFPHVGAIVAASLLASTWLLDSTSSPATPGWRTNPPRVPAVTSG